MEQVRNGKAGYNHTINATTKFNRMLKVKNNITSLLDTTSTFLKKFISKSLQNRNATTLESPQEKASLFKSLREKLSELNLQSLYMRVRGFPTDLRKLKNNISKAGEKALQTKLTTGVLQKILKGEETTIDFNWSNPLTGDEEALMKDLAKYTQELKDQATPLSRYNQRKQKINAQIRLIAALSQGKKYTFNKQPQTDVVTPHVHEEHFNTRFSTIPQGFETLFGKSLVAGIDEETKKAARQVFEIKLQKARDPSKKIPISGMFARIGENEGNTRGYFDSHTISKIGPLPKPTDEKLDAVKKLTYGELKALYNEWALEKNSETSTAGRLTSYTVLYLTHLTTDEQKSVSLEQRRLTSEASSLSV